MFIKLNGNDVELTATSIVEQKLINQGEAKGWVLLLNLTGDFSAIDIDSVFTTESISEITLVGEAEKATVISGYNKITRCVVRYSENTAIAEIQLTKGV